MAWFKNQKKADHQNMAVANVSHSTQLRRQGPGQFLCRSQTPPSFLISGGQPFDRYNAVYPFLSSYLGTMPMVVLHNGGELGCMVQNIWMDVMESGEGLWMTDRENPYFEPFLGMDDMQVVTTSRNLAGKLGYNVSARFERIVQAHLRLLRELEIPVSLTGLSYLCEFQDMGEFHDNVMALPCGSNAAMRLWNDLSTEHDDFYLFRSVVTNLAAEAPHCGWMTGNECADLNCLEAIRVGATLVMQVDGQRMRLMLPYLLEEFKCNEGKPFLLLLDNLRITDPQVLEYLSDTSSGCICGMLSENAVEAVAAGEDHFRRLAARMQHFLIFKHGTGTTATALSEIMGRYDYNKVETTRNTSRGFFSFLPDSSSEGIAVHQENRYRVMPEEITALGPGMAIVFDAVTNQIIKP